MGPLSNLKAGNRIWISILGIGILFQLLSCSTHVPPTASLYGFRSRPAEFNLGDKTRFEFKIGRIASDGRQRLLLAYDKYDRASGQIVGSFFRLSEDSGSSFQDEHPLPAGTSSFVCQFALYRDQVNVLYGGWGSNPEQAAVNISFARLQLDGATWSEPVQVNDEQNSVVLNAGGSFSVVQRTADEFDCVWTDARRGFWLTFFSASRDGGRTWSPNEAVEHDFREASQLAPQLVAGAGGRLLVFWHDDRDRGTLFDIRCSYSDDGGQHWTLSQKVNDDQEHVWQTRVEAVAKDNRIYVAFEDYREPGEGGGNDWNIYFSESPDNGETWRPNIRLNDVKRGVDGGPVLAIDNAGTLYCIWQSARDSIFGGIFFSYSTDEGRSWSPSIKVNQSDDLILRQTAPNLLSMPDGRLLARWRERLPGFDQIRLAWIEPLSAPQDQRPATAEEPKEMPWPSEGRTYFREDFSNATTDHWQTVAGVWTVIDGAFRGVEPGAQAPFTAFARLKEPESYILRGRFKLDPLHHRMAYIYFRANPGNGKSYLIENGFQNGACLSIKEDDSPPLPFGPFALLGQPLTQRPYPFQNDRWYEFVLAVTPNGIKYYIDGKEILTYTGRLKLSPGSLGIGGFGSAPTYFDRIAVSELK